MEEKIKSEVYNRLMLACQQVMYQGYTVASTAAVFESMKLDDMANESYEVLGEALKGVTEVLEKILDYKDATDNICGADIAICKVSADLVYGRKDFGDFEGVTVTYEGDN